MKKLLYLVAFCLVGIIVATSCSDNKTYAQLLDEEKKAIRKFISENNLEIINYIPDEFGPKQYYKHDSTGVYYQIVDRGDTSVMAVGRSLVSVRVSEVTYLRDNTLDSLGNLINPYPLTFTYNNPVNSGGSVGLYMPLSHVGENGVVRIIIPSKQGFTADAQAVIPVHFGRVQYSRIEVRN